MRYVFVDRITRLEPGRILSACKNVTFSDGLATTYLPGISALPASMVLETMAQAAGLLVAATVPAPSLPVLAKVQPFSAHGLARPGDCVTVDARLEDVREEGCRTTVTAAVGGRLLAEATIYLALIPVDGAEANALHRRLIDLFAAWFDAERQPGLAS